MNKFHEVLTEQLSRESNFINDNGDLKKFIIIDAAYNINPRLIELLIEIDEIKNKFFTEIKGHWVFDINLFVQYMENKNFLKDSYTRYKNKIGLNINGKFLNQRNEVSLVRPFKECVLEGGQNKEDQKRPEIFFNELLAQEEIDQLFEPKILTNWKRYTTDGEEKVTKLKTDKKGNIKENLIIKGNNLLALHSLLPRFEEKVKLIYIDPPYNTGNDSFGYNDNFNHSTWLTFMKNRLETAKRLLRKDGSIWINIGDEEAHYLKVMLDSIFPKGFIVNVLWQKRTSPDSRLVLGDAHDHILVFSKDERNFRERCNPIPLTDEQKRKFKNPDNDPKGAWVSTDFTATGFRPNQMYEITTPKGAKYSPPPRKCWSKIESEFFKLDKEDRIWYGINGNAMPRRKTYLSESKGITSWSWWANKEVGHNQEAKQESINLFGINSPFSTPKPEKLLQRIIHIGSNKGDIVLDFFAGSSTTAAVAHKMNRQFITIEQMDYIDTITVERLKKVIGKNEKSEGELLEKLMYDEGGISKVVNWQGGGDFVYCELKKYNQAFIEQIEVAKDSKKLLKIWEEMKEHSFINYNVDIKKQDDEIEDFKELTLQQQKDILLQILNKNQLYVNLSSIDDEDFKVSEEDKKLTKEFYDIKAEENSEQLKAEI
ncbi:MAG: site-specific DNA-methyltransferase [Candidatus Tenebribacter mawsonii]|nr:site-specific DNA-methyltransferase [Candidatus Tenebribacter mawsonii]